VIERMRLSDERNRAKAVDHDQDMLQYWQHAADSGDQNAQLALGQLHYFGARGVQRDLQRAREYYQAAADAGVPAAMSNLGQMYAQGIGIDKNNETALKYYRLAAAKVCTLPCNVHCAVLISCVCGVVCTQGDPSAHNGLGFMYMNGRGVTQDYKTALRHFKIAAEHGNADSMYNLGVLYFGMLLTTLHLQSYCSLS